MADQETTEIGILSRGSEAVVSLETNALREQSYTDEEREMR